MDIKAKELIGLPVVTFNRGIKAYEVEDLILDPERKQVLALLVEDATLFGSARAIPFGRISAIGPDAVIIPDGKAVIDVNRDAVLKRLHNKQSVRGLRVLTDDGRKLGTVEDMLLDNKTGEIRGYYVSIGRMVNVGQGMKWLPAESVLNMGMRVLYVPATAAQDFEQQSGGLAGALDQAGDRVRAAGSKANERLENLGGKAKESGARFNEQLGQLGEQVRTDVTQRAGSVVTGKTAHDTVTAQDGTPIVQQGETITEQHVERAKAENRLNQLFLSAGVRPAGNTVSNITEQAGQSFNEIRSEARDLWNQLTGGYARQVELADDKQMERRIKNALGRPASRVILDNDDNVILNTGDIITNRAVQAARDAGVLDILVASAYVERPKLDLQDLKAPISGEASLDVTTTGASAASRQGVPTRAKREARSTVAQDKDFREPSSAPDSDLLDASSQAPDVQATQVQEEQS
jgi:uncharacterized protein YrrD